MAVPASVSTIFSLPRSLPNSRYRRQTLRFRCMSSPSGEEEYLVDAPVSIGDGFSFSGGKYSDGPSRSDEWFAQGKMIKAHPVYGGKGKAKDPIFGLTMGAGSQSPADVFRLLRQNASSLLMDDVYSNTGPLQFDGPGADAKAITLCVEDQDYMGQIKLLQEYLDKVKSIVKPGCSQDVLKAALSAMASVTDVLAVMASPSSSGQPPF